MDNKNLYCINEYCILFNSFKSLLNVIKSKKSETELQKEILNQELPKQNPITSDALEDSQLPAVEEPLMVQSEAEQSVTLEEPEKANEHIALEEPKSEKLDLELAAFSLEEPFLVLPSENDQEIAQVSTYTQKSQISEYNPNLFYFFGDFLYFKAIEDSLIYAEKVPQTPTFRPKVKNIKQDFKYEPGFRVGMGYDFYDQRWKLRTSWMYYNVSPEKRHASDPNFGLLATLDIPVWGALGNSLVNSLEGKWLLKMNVVDIDVRRQFDFAGFSIAPVGGIKLALIEQKIHAHYGDFLIDYSNVVTPHNVQGKSTFFGLGPLLGIELSYKLPKQWKFFLNGNFSWLIGEFHTITTYTDFTPVTPSDPSESEIKIKNHTNRVSLFEHVQAGIDKRWSYKNGAFEMAVGWELQVFQNQMDLNYFSTFVSPPSGADLSLYGPFIRARLDF